MFMSSHIFMHACISPFFHFSRRGGGRRREPSVRTPSGTAGAEASPKQEPETANRAFCREVQLASRPSATKTFDGTSAKTLSQYSVPRWHHLGGRQDSDSGAQFSAHPHCNPGSTIHKHYICVRFLPSICNSPSPNSYPESQRTLTKTNRWKHGLILEVGPRRTSESPDLPQTQEYISQPVLPAMGGGAVLWSVRQTRW